MNVTIPVLRDGRFESHHVFVTRLFQTALLFLAVCAIPRPAGAQVFTNLDFEQAVIPNDTQFADEIDASTALPGWTATIEGQVQSSVYYVDGALDSNVVALSPNAIQGSYSAKLTGVESLPGTAMGVSLSQTGMIPTGIKSIEFQAGQELVDSEIENIPGLTVDGSTINLYDLSTTGGVTTWIGDVSSYAGTTATLSFNAAPDLNATVPPGVHTSENSFILDSISFSDVPAPESPVESLLAIGLMFCMGAFRRRIFQRRAS